MITIDQETALNIERSVYQGEIFAFERVEKMLKDRQDTIHKILKKSRGANLNHPLLQRKLEIGMFLDEVHIMKRQTRQAHAETLTK